MALTRGTETFFFWTYDSWLIDLDASRYTPDAPVDGSAQLSRLRRSLEKLWPSEPDAPPLETAWRDVLEGATK